MGNKHINPSCIRLNLQFLSDADDRLRDRYDSNAAEAAGRETQSILVCQYYRLFKHTLRYFGMTDMPCICKPEIFEGGPVLIRNELVEQLTVTERFTQT